MAEPNMPEDTVPALSSPLSSPWPSPLPWQQQQREQCLRSAQAQTLPHALLISGQAGLGKLDFARTFSQLLLCDSPQADGVACGHCQGCHLFTVGNHPDFRQVDLEEGSSQIKIDQIRSINNFMSLSRQYSHYKIVVIPAAETMNHNAANSLLKTLEEPPGWSLIILVTSRPALLTATIRSRCQKLEFNIPPYEQSLSWLQNQLDHPDPALVLKLAGGAPLTALQLVEGDLLQVRQSVFTELTAVLSGEQSPVAVAKRWAEVRPELIVSWLIAWLADAIRLVSGAQADHLDNPDIIKGLNSLIKQVDLGQLFGLYGELLQVRRMLGGSLNMALMMEDVLIAWKMAFK